MSTYTSLYTSLNYHLVSFALYSHHVSKHDFIFRTIQFIDMRCKKWGELLTTFFFLKSSTAIFITISVWCPSLWILQCNGFSKYCNLTEPNKTVFQRFQARLFPHITQSVLVVLLQGCFNPFMTEAVII